MRRTAVILTLFACGVGTSPSQAATRLAPAEIQSQFFNGQPFTASTPSNTAKFRMVFTSDGKATREPQGRSGSKSEGTWKLSKDGYCTTWKGSKASCFTVVLSAPNKWSVMRGPAVVAIWTK